MFPIEKVITQDQHIYFLERIGGCRCNHAPNSRRGVVDAQSRHRSPRHIMPENIIMSERNDEDSPMKIISGFEFGS